MSSKYLKTALNQYAAIGGLALLLFVSAAMLVSFCSVQLHAHPAEHDKKNVVAPPKPDADIKIVTEAGEQPKPCKGNPLRRPIHKSN